MPSRGTPDRHRRLPPDWLASEGPGSPGYTRRGVKKMDIQEEVRSELLRLNVPITSLGGFQFDSSEEPKEVRVDYEGVTGTFDPEHLLSLLKILPDRAGSIVVVEALRISGDRR